MVNRQSEIAEKMPWVKKKENPQKPWDNPSQDGSGNSASRMVANRDDVINKIKSIQTKLNLLTEEKDALAEEKDALAVEKEEIARDLEDAREKIVEKNSLIDEKDDSIKGLNSQVESMEIEKQKWDDKLEDLQKALKTATSEKSYLEQELAAADKAIGEINNLLSS